MVINNIENVKRIKKVFYLGAAFIAVLALVLFFAGYFFPALIGIGIFPFWYFFFQVADYQYIEFNNEKNKIILRYYKVIKFGKPAYNSIEIQHTKLLRVYFEDSFFGKLTDVTLIVKTNRGAAEYPSVSLTALPKADRMRLKIALLEEV